MSDKCSDIRERAADALVSGVELPADVELHLNACRECTQFVEALREDELRLLQFAEAADASIARVKERVQQALREEAVVPLSPREGVMFKRIVWVAAAAIVGTVAIGYLTGQFGPASTAWADVQKKIEQAVSVTYVERFEPEDMPPFEILKSASADGRLRSVYPDSDVTIMDFNLGVTLNMWPSMKRAMVVTRTGMPERNGLFNYVDWIKALHRESATFLRQENVDGVKTNVYEVRKSEFKTHTIWVDAATDLPVRVEMTTTPADDNVVVPSLMLNLGDYGGDPGVARTVSFSNSAGIARRMKITMSSFNWNVALDDSLFSLEAPKSYRVEKSQFDVSDKGANDLAIALRTWVDLSGGSLPDSIAEIGNQSTVPSLLKKKYDRAGKPEDELEQALATANQLLKGLMFAEQVRLSGEWRYLGRTATLGDSSSVICRWRWKESDDYQALFGNFRVGAVTQE